MYTTPYKTWFICAYIYLLIYAFMQYTLKNFLSAGHGHFPQQENTTNGTTKCFRAECNCFVTYLLLGMLGFVIFWCLLMLRIYLPEEYWKWSYIWSWSCGYHVCQIKSNIRSIEMICISNIICVLSNTS